MKKDLLNSSLYHVLSIYSGSSTNFKVFSNNMHSLNVPCKMKINFYFWKIQSASIFPCKDGSKYLWYQRYSWGTIPRILKNQKPPFVLQSMLFVRKEFKIRVSTSNKEKRGTLNIWKLKSFYQFYMTIGTNVIKRV